ncbi:response regulator transcription factor [Bacillus solimangrovi]|uniref:DNA-binding response regulator n=1 Tax=Bacillus solimangrovi TaxID=1305675 RepID=A0A1E5LGA2_9BACI|nr:response regulator transcription factor [Bacillus solimangrovi]OEH93102.1 DNA-binding response regulator [Bacillus solimangrovi]
MGMILIVEDEMAISRVLKAYLEKAGFQTETAFDGDEAIEKFDNIQPSLVLLDVMLPNRDGWSILKEIRSISSCPVIMLTALGDINYKLTGLNSGADDYISKPFIGDEVVARVNAVLRRPKQVYEEHEVRYFGSLKVDLKAVTVSLNGVDLNLSPRDLSLLIFLAQNSNQTFTREQLIEHVWGIDYDGSDRAVDLSIKRIRQSLRNWSNTEGEIKTIRGLGYQFSVHT